MPNDDNAAMADSDKQNAVIIDAQLLSCMYPGEHVRRVSEYMLK